MLKVKRFTGKETVSINEIIATLDELVKLDPVWMQKRCLTRYACNAKIRDHESVQVHCYNDATTHDPKAGCIGLLNGLLGVDERHYGPVAAERDENATLTGFKLTPYPKTEASKTKSDRKEK